MLSLKRAVTARATRVDPDTAIRIAEQGRRNFKIGVVNGVLAGILDPLSGIFVLTLFLARLDAPAFLVGLLPTIASCGGLLPQLIVAGKLRGRKRVMPWYTRATVFRVAGLAGMAISAWLIPLGREMALVSLFAGYILYMFSSGVSGIPFMEVVAKIVPTHRKGTFFGYRQFGSAVLGMVTSAIAGAVMSEQLGLVFPYNFAAMLTAATVAGAVVFGLWSLVREPDLEQAHAPRPQTGSIFRHGATALQANRDYRLLTMVRLLATFAGISGPFYLVYAAKALQVPVGVLAVFLTVQTAVPLVAGLLWMPLANKAPRRTLVLITTSLQLAVPVTALTVGAVAGMVPGGWHAYIVAPIFIAGSLATSSAVMFNDLVLLSIAPPAERPVYFGFLNTLAGVASLTLPVGGLLLEYLGYTPLFLLSGVLALCSLVVGRGIERPPREGPTVARRAMTRARERGRLMVALPMQSV
ncbi:MAG: MFS transporter, partial [Chloroflexota bacterium]|nr:MFS transporter [Chloroflexota bacterium]